jgi:hypothetical protein
LRRELLLEHWTLDGTRLRAFSAARERFVPGEQGNVSQGRKWT